MDIVKNIIDWLKDIGTKLGEGFTNIGKWFTELPSKITDGIAYLFDPSKVEPDFDLGEKLLAKLSIVNQIQTAANNIQSTGEPLSFTAQMGNWKIDINLNWFEPYRGHLRSGLSTVFWVACAMACWRNISNVFGISVGSKLRDAN